MDHSLNITVRMKYSMLDDFEKLVAISGESRNAIINNALYFALEHLEIIDFGNNKKNDDDDKSKKDDSDSSKNDKKNDDLDNNDSNNENNTNNSNVETNGSPNNVNTKNK